MNLKKDNDSFATLHFQDLAKIIWLHKWVVAVMMCLTLLCGVAFVILKAPVYQTTALMQVNLAQNSNQSQLANVLSSIGDSGSSGSTQASLASIEMALMQSPYILEPTIRKLNLDVAVAPAYFPLIGAYLARNANSDTPVPAKFGLDHYFWGGETWSLHYFIVPASEIKQRFKLVVGENQAYQLFNAKDQLVLTGRAGQAAASADGTVQLAWNTLNARPGEVIYLTKLSYTETLHGLEQAFQLSELSASQNGIAAAGGGGTGIVQLGLNSAHPDTAVKILNTILDFTLHDNLYQKELSSSKTLAFIQQQLATAKTAMLDAKLKLDQEEQKTGIISLQGQSTGLLAEITQVNSQLGSAKATQAQYQLLYTNANPLMQSLNTQIASLQRQKAQLQQQIAALPLKDQNSLNLMQDAEVKSKIYMNLLLDQQQSMLAKASMLSDLRVLDFAQAADEPLPTYSFLILLASLLGGAILGCLLVLARHQLKNVVSDPYWTEREFGIRTVSIVPYSATQAAAKKAGEASQAGSIPILAITAPDDVCIESIRSLRTSLFFALKEKQTNVVSITGVVPQTGKSFIAVNLATILAQTGKRVALVDADMRRGYLHRYFNKSHAPGLSDILSGMQPLEQVISTTSVANLDFIATGIYPDHPSELLLNSRFKTMLDTLSQHYDLVIVDSPPILAVNDASVIAQAIALNYLVIPGGQLKAQEIEVAIRRFHNDGVVLSGVLYNFVKQHAEKMPGNITYNDYTRHYQKDTAQQK